MSLAVNNAMINPPTSVDTRVLPHTTTYNHKGRKHNGRQLEPTTNAFKIKKGIDR